MQSDILAAIALEQLKKIDWVKRRRRQNAIFLSSKLARFEPLIKIPRTIEGAESNHHIYAIMLQEKTFRGRFINLLRKEGIECSTHFVPLNASPFAQRYLGYKKGDCPVTEKVCDSLVRLPVYPQLHKGDLEYIAAGIENVIGDTT